MRIDLILESSAAPETIAELGHRWQLVGPRCAAGDVRCENLAVRRRFRA